MHLVFVSSLVPSGPPESGYEIANQVIIDGLRRAGARVTVLGYKWPGAELTDPENTVCLGEIDVRTDTASGRRKLEWLAKAVRTGLTFSSAKLRVVPESDVAAALKRIEPFDGFVLNSVQLAGAYERLFTERPYVFVAHNVEHISATQNADEAVSPVEKIMYRREARLLKTLEHRLCAGARFVMTLADEDREPLGVADADRSRTVPLVTPEAPQYSGLRYTAFDIGMIGTWTWAPNRVGLEWFLQKVLPLLPQLTTVAIAGRMPRGFPARDPRVNFLGRVEDAKEFMRQCRVIALASRAGTGVQLKTIETLELGLPAVATSLSLRGIDNVPSNIGTADTPESFAEMLQQMIVGQRTGTVPDLDGSAFRASQIADCDAVIAAVLDLYSGKN